MERRGCEEGACWEDACYLGMVYAVRYGYGGRLCGNDMSILRGGKARNRIEKGSKEEVLMRYWVGVGLEEVLSGVWVGV